jgi:putative Mg2+ transporter-C (MgtC) family protein
VADLSVAEVVGRLLLAAVLGACIGAEREVDGRDAGLRTHLMLSLGAGLFGVISVGAWDQFADRTADTNFRVDVTRVASYVAAGIGFLGGGAILKQAGGVRGLTTAASLWVAAAVGLASGVGMWVAAVASTAGALLSLAVLKPVRDVVRRASRRSGTNLFVVARDASAFPEVVRAIQDGKGFPDPSAVRAGPAADGNGYEILVEYAQVPPAVVTLIAERVGAIPGVERVHVGR